MPDPGRQLAFTLPARPRLGRSDFLVGRSNEAALRQIESWPGWPARLLHLAGPPGSGKSHLAAIWAERAGATLIAAADVTTPSVPALIEAGPIALEDVGTGGANEAALFHLVNRARDGAVDLLFTSEGRLDAKDVALPDLRSRLRLAPRLLLDPPDDDLFRAVMAKLFADRQLAVGSEVFAYLEHRIERSFDAARAIVAQLDAEALRRRRPVTRALAAEIVGEAPDPGEDEDSRLP